MKKNIMKLMVLVAGMMFAPASMNAQESAEVEAQVAETHYRRVTNTIKN